MEIEVGEYIKTNEGIIGKIKRIEFDNIDKSLKWYVFDKKRPDMNIIDEVYINKPYIVKHSKNIIDLIEVGDFSTISADGEELTIEVDKIDYEHKLKNIADDIKIKSIVTKEQFENIKYDVEE